MRGWKLSRMTFIVSEKNPISNSFIFGYLFQSYESQEPKDCYRKTTHVYHYLATCRIIVTTPTQLQRNLNCSWRLDMKMTVHTHPDPPPHHTNSMSLISQLLLTRFWPNFKDRFLGLSWTDSNCHSDICPGNICQGDICPYQEYLSCYWPDFDQSLKVVFWDHLNRCWLSGWHLSWQHLSISGISQLLLTQF